MDDGQTLRSMVRDDAYEVVRVLADGPSGKTELVTLDGEGPLVRKSIPLEIANPAAWAAAMDIDDPMLPKIESLYRLPDMLVVVYEYVQGDSLKVLMEQGARFSTEQVANYVCNVCHATSCLHSVGVVHRDITPSNIIVGNGKAHLVDLGIARQQRGDARHDTTTLGTWGFAAPEQFGFAQTSARSDVYSIGRVLGYLLTGVSPSSSNYEQELAKVADAGGKRGRLATISQRAATFEPSGRYQSAYDLETEIRSAMLPRQDAATMASTGLPQAGAQQEAPASGLGALFDRIRSFVSGPRLPKDAPLLLRLANGLTVAAASVVIFILTIAAIGSGPGSKNAWGPGEIVLSLSIIVAAVGLAVETHRYATLWGVYAIESSKFLLYLKRVCIFISIVFAVMAITIMAIPEPLA